MKNTKFDKWLDKKSDKAVKVFVKESDKAIFLINSVFKCAYEQGYRASMRDTGLRQTFSSKTLHNLLWREILPQVEKKIIQAIQMSMWK